MIMDVVPKKTPYKCTMERQARRFLNPAKRDKFPYVISVLNGLQLQLLHYLFDIAAS